MSDKRKKSKSGPLLRLMWISLSVVLLIAVIMLLFTTEDTANVTRSSAPPPVQVVTVMEVPVRDTVAKVTAFAEMRPRWDATILSAVSGRVIQVHDEALAGEHVAAGAPLFSIEKTPYQAAVAAAELNLEQARMALMQAKASAALAREEFDRVSTSEPSELALQLPQLRIAERTVVAAEAELENARRQLVDTDVTAPFSGFVTQRMANLGQTVAAGDPLIHLSDDRQYELAVALSEADWALLEQPVAGRRATLFHRSGALIGHATVRRGGGYLDPQTRQPRIFLDVENPDEAIISGDFVRVVMTGRLIENTLTVPESALTRMGYIWHVDENDMLVRIEPQVLFRSEGMIVIAAPEGLEVWHIATTPLASFLPGLRVAPQSAEG